MIAISHTIAISLYLGAAVLAAAPFARPVRAPVRWVLLTLGAGVAAHLTGLVALAVRSGQPPVTGLGPALSCAGLAIAVTLLAVESVTHDLERGSYKQSFTLKRSGLLPTQATVPV